jgi:hypothetical protein
MALILKSVRSILDGAVELLTIHHDDAPHVSEVVKRELSAPEPHLGQDRHSLSRDMRRVERGIDRGLRSIELERSVCNG